MKERIGFQLGFCGLAGDFDEQYREDVLEQDVPQTSRNRLGDDEEGTNFGVCPLNGDRILSYYQVLISLVVTF